MKTVMVDKCCNILIGTLVPDEEYALLSADQFMEALANTDSLVVVRQHDGELCVVDAEGCRDVELTEEALTALAAVEDLDAADTIVEAAEEEMRRRQEEKVKRGIEEGKSQMRALLDATY
jgi:hypothetical protein